MTATLTPLLTPGRGVPLLYIIGIILFAMLGNAAYDAARAWLGTILAVSLLAGLGLVVLLVANEVARYVGRPKFVNPDIRRRRGLIVLVSQGRLDGNPADSAISYHIGSKEGEPQTPILEYCWLVTSSPPQNSGNPAAAADAPAKVASSPEATTPPTFAPAYENAVKLRERYGQRVTCRLVEVDPNDVEDVYAQVSAVLLEARRRGLTRDELAVDFTGGTKEMSVGMAFAAIALGFRLERMRPRELTVEGRAVQDKGSDPFVHELPRIAGSNDG